MQKRGKTAKGTQRWYCPWCQTSAVKTRQDTRLRYRRQLFTKWSTGFSSRATIAKTYSVNRRTITRWVTPVLQEPSSFSHHEGTSGNMILCDGLHINGRYGVLLLIRTIMHPVVCIEVLWESSDTWRNAFSFIEKPSVIVGDGQKGMIRAARMLWPSIRFQRCLVHIQRLCMIRISQHPTTKAGQELSILVSSVFSVWTRRQKRRWIRAFHRWQKRYDSVINEKLVLMYPSGRKSWRYAHSRLHAARSLLRNALPDMFTYVGHWEIPRTTNYCEGGLNAPIKELLHRHRGTLPSTKKAIVIRYLLKRSKKPPRNVP